ncbi:sensor histidine kinase [Aquabacterium humicola]|uniref:sensor histidine kinase n=1 Tax=Aquabacterium humicola TaxID=3237377 RepID=UPI0025436A08|nr:PAS domain S-box protein [Rubrivivax pictus]
MNAPHGAPAALAADSGPAPELLARAFNAAPSGFVLVDRAGRIVAANDELLRMFAYPSEALVGQPLEMLLPAAVRDRHVPLREAFFERPSPRAMGAGRVLYARRADGHEFPVEIGLNPVPRPDGEPLVLASVVDISERLALEWAFRGVFDAAPVGMLIIDDGGHIAMANRVLCDALGYGPALLVGQPMDRLLPERYRPRHGALMASYRQTGEARMMGQGRDLTALHADGSELEVEIGLRRVRWQRQTMTLAAITDISGRKRLERELRQANANLEEFTYVASHDLRSPLRGIADLVDWIEDDLSDPPQPVRHNLGRIRQRILRMERLMDDLLSYARAGRAATELSTIDIGALVPSVLELQPLPLGFEVALAIDSQPFQGTRTPLETVLRNLLSNAIKHHDRDSGRLRVEVRQDDVYCVIDVVDDGPGVPEAAHERIFKLFQTASAAGERGGSGIGLALTKRLVEVHGGRIELQSPLADQRGACFRVHWPRFPRRASED